VLRIVQAEGARDIEQVRLLFREYENFLGFDLCFQSFEKELAELPGRYAPPWGRLYLAEFEGCPAGCIALRQIGEGVCEMKRLYVRPEFRGKKIGRALAERLLQEARLIGYQVMRLDTLARLTEAVSLYRSLGFRSCAPYVPNPIADAVFMELTL